MLDIVAKGENLALNISPQPDGRLPGRAVKELKILSKWMKILSPAIYGTRSVAPFCSGKYTYTRTNDFKKINVFYMYDDNEKISETYEIPFDKKATCVTYMRNKASLKFEQTEGVLKVEIPKDISGQSGNIADCFVVDVKYNGK